MVQKFIHVFILAIAVILSYSLFAPTPVEAKGETWTLTDSTTLTVKDGIIDGTITLKPRDGTGSTDPNVWIQSAGSAIDSGNVNRKLCVVMDSQSLIDIRAGRKNTGKINGIINPANCNEGPTNKWTGSGLDDSPTFTSNLKVDTPKCGDAGFTGPCAEPFDPGTTDCSSLADAAARTRCESIKTCVSNTDATAGECTSGWDTCLATYADADEAAKATGVSACAAAIKTADFEGGKYTDPGPDEDASSCKVEGIGWIICPVMNFMGMITDGSYTVVETMLKTPVSMFDTSKSEGQMTQAVWSTMRNIANALFVIAFMVIIYSQLTSTGITNYGVKKLLPKLVISAVLVNVSFIVCALAVDLSNVIGSATKGLFDSLAVSIQVDDDGMNIGNGGNNAANIVGGVLAGAGIATAVMYVQLSALLPILIGALAAIVTVVIVLTMRQALIILLIVISPLAFVALLLPNTEGWFKKWRGLFFVLLLMFPVVAAIFGASALAGQIIMNSSPGNVLVQIMGVGITIIPLFITPVIMKAAGGVLNRFGGIVNNTDKGMFDRMRKGAEGYRKNRKDFRSLKAMSGGNVMPGVGKATRWRARRNAVIKNRQSELNRSNSEYIAEKAEGSDRFRGQLSNGGGLGANDRALAAAINVQAKLEADEVSAATAVIEHAELSGSERQTLATTGTVTKAGRTYSSDTMQKAAIQEQLRKGSMDDIHKIVELSGAASSLGKFSQSISDGIAKNGVASKNPSLGGRTLDDIAQGRINGADDLNNIIERQVNAGKVTAESLAGMDNLARKRTIDIAQSSSNPETLAQLKTAAEALNNTPELKARVAGNTEARAQIDSLTSQGNSSSFASSSLPGSPVSAGVAAGISNTTINNTLNTRQSPQPQVESNVFVVDRSGTASAEKPSAPVRAADSQSEAYGKEMNKKFQEINREQRRNT